MLNPVSSNFRKFTAASFLLFLSSFSSCNFFQSCLEGEGNIVKSEIQLESFHSIELSSHADVTIKQGDSQTVSIETHENLIPLFKTKISDGVWGISTERCIKTQETVKIYIQLSELKDVEILGSGSVIGENEFSGSQFNFQIKGSGDLDLMLNAKEVNTEISGSGEIKLTGRAKKHSIEIDGSGDINAKELKTDVSKIEINGSGDAFINVSYELDVEVNGSGDVNYIGSVKKLNSEINGSGRLNQLN